MSISSPCSAGAEPAASSRSTKTEVSYAANSNDAGNSSENSAEKLLLFSFGEIAIYVQPPLKDEEGEAPVWFSDPFDDGPAYDDTGLFHVWPASVSLCHFLHQHPALVVQKRVLELGCGAGLPGLLCAQLGAAYTVSTDRNEQVVRRIVKAHRRGNVAPERARAQELDWTATLELGRMVWEEEIDVVIAADLVCRPTRYE